MKSVQKFFLAAGLLAAFSVSASAAPITWTLNGVLFNIDGTGGTTGSFVYDVDTNTYSNVNLVTDYTTTSGTPYTIVDPTFFGSGFVQVWNAPFTGDRTGQRTLVLSFDGDLTNDGGSYRLASAENACDDGECTGLHQASLGFWGTVDAPTPGDAPEPATFVLVGSSVIGLGLVRRRTKA